jgi:hypothetical protein
MRKLNLIKNEIIFLRKLLTTDAKLQVQLVQPSIASRKEDDNLIEKIDEETLQAHWASMERRVKNRKPKPKGEGPSGRTDRRISAWDAENV